MTSAAKVDTSGFTPGGYIDAMEAAGEKLWVTGLEPARRCWLTTHMRIENDPLPETVIANQTRWQLLLHEAGRQGMRDVCRELHRRGQWQRFDTWPEWSRLEQEKPVRGYDYKDE